MTETLARIDWKMGQTLLPEHFVAQEDALIADSALRFGMMGVPFHGIGRLRWNDSLLAEFEKNIEGAWSLIEEFVPPLLQVGTSPFLGRMLDRLSKTIQMFHEKLREDIAASYLGGEGLFSAKTCLKGIYAIERVLANV